MSKKNRRYNKAPVITKQDLEQQLVELQEKYNLLNKENKEYRHQLSVLKSKMQKVERKYQAAKTSLQRSAAITSRVQKMNISVKLPPKKKGNYKNLTMEEKTAVHQNVYIPQFMKRLKEHYGDAFTETQYAEMEAVLRTLDADTIYYDIVKVLDLNHLYFDSGSDYVDTVEDMEAVELYEYIMGFKLG